MKYVYNNFKPQARKHIIVTYSVGKKNDLKDIAHAIAQYVTLGTAQEIPEYCSLKQFEKMAPRAFALNNRKREFKVAYPLALFEKNSVTHLLSFLHGSILAPGVPVDSMITDVEIPQSYSKSFLGPYWGTRILKYFKNRLAEQSVCYMSQIQGQLICTQAQMVKLIKQRWYQGMDMIVEDVRLGDFSSARFYQRVRAILQAKKEVEAETGMHKMYFFNVTGTPDVIYERSDFIRKMGGRGVVIDVAVTGIDNVHMLRKSKLGMLIYARHALAEFVSGHVHVLSPRVQLQLLRLAGADVVELGDFAQLLPAKKQTKRGAEKFFTEDLGAAAIFEKMGGLHQMVPVMPVGHSLKVDAYFADFVSQNIILDIR
jgi:ribulose-bisphosphate carboxylase large chain